VPYPVSITIEPQHTNRDRLTTAFRVVLAIPHLIVVGGVGLGLAVSGGGNDKTSLTGETGLLRLEPERDIFILRRRED